MLHSSQKLLKPKKSTWSFVELVWLVDFDVKLAMSYMYDAAHTTKKQLRLTLTLSNKDIKESRKSMEYGGS